jgi:hypothetical protein
LTLTHATQSLGTLVFGIRSTQWLPDVVRRSFHHAVSAAQVLDIPRAVGAKRQFSGGGPRRFVRRKRCRGGGSRGGAGRGGCRGSECSVVGVTGGASGVVEGAGAGEESSAHDEVRVVGSDGIPLG